jgi:hypothetical protein
MALTITDLTTEITEEQAVDFCKNVLSSSGFPTNDFEEGSFGLAVIELASNLLVRYSQYTNSFTRAAFLDTAEEGFLDMLGRSHYQEPRLSAVAWSGVVTCACDGATPQTKLAGDILFSETYSGVVYTYINTEDINIVATGDVDVPVKCTSLGADTNPATLTLNTTIKGVSVGIAVTTTSGRDAESDASYKKRCSLKWRTLSESGLKGAYEYHVIAATGSSGEFTGATRVYVDDTTATSSGYTPVYVAGSTPSTFSVTALSNISDYLNDRIPLCASASLHNAATLSIDVCLTASYDPLAPWSDPATEYFATLEAAIEDTFNELPIGGIRFNEIDLLGGIHDSYIKRQVFDKTDWLNALDFKSTALPSGSYLTGSMYLAPTEIFKVNKVDVMWLKQG